MAVLYKYRVWCDTDSQWEYLWSESETAPTTCPADPVGHTIDSNKTSVVETTEGEAVEIANMATLEKPTVGYVQRFVQQPARSGYYMSFRDFKLTTATLSDTFEDLRVNTSTNKRTSWGELSFVGCYKGDDSSGYTACSDETDANNNGVLSIWDYVANDQAETPAALDVDTMGGTFWCDKNLSGDAWGHQLYCVLAPNIPTSMGGSLPFFDSYLYPYEGQWISCLNTFGFPLDPSVTQEAARVRTYVYYPAGTQNNHVLGLKIYRTVW